MVEIKQVSLEMFYQNTLRLTFCKLFCITLLQTSNQTHFLVKALYIHHSQPANLKSSNSKLCSTTTSILLFTLVLPLLALVIPVNVKFWDISYNSICVNSH